MATEEQQANSVDLNEKIRRMVSDGRLTFSEDLRIHCNDCKRKLGTYRGEHFTLVPRNVDITVEADILCDRCRMKRNEKRVEGNNQTTLS